METRKYILLEGEKMIKLLMIYNYYLIKGYYMSKKRGCLQLYLNRLVNSIAVEKISYGLG